MVGHRLSEDSLPHVRGITQHSPDHRPVPAILAGTRQHALVGQPAGQISDGHALVGVTAEHLSDQNRLVLHHLVAGTEAVAPPPIMISKRRPRKHIHRPGPRTVRLPASVALQNLRFLVLGEHPLELDQ